MDFATQKIYFGKNEMFVIGVDVKVCDSVALHCNNNLPPFTQYQLS